MTHVAGVLQQQGRDVRTLTSALHRATAAIGASVVRDPRAAQFQLRPDDPRVHTHLSTWDPRVQIFRGAGPIRDPRLTALLALARIRWVRIVSTPFPIESRL